MNSNESKKQLAKNSRTQLLISDRCCNPWVVRLPPTAQMRKHRPRRSWHLPSFEISLSQDMTRQMAPTATEVPFKPRQMALNGSIKHDQTNQVALIVNVDDTLSLETIYWQAVIDVIGNVRIFEICCIGKDPISVPDIFNVPDILGIVYAPVEATQNFSSMRSDSELMIEFMVDISILLCDLLWLTNRLHHIRKLQSCTTQPNHCCP